MPNPVTLGSGTLTASKTTLYTATASCEARISICNSGTNGTQSATLYIKPSGGSSIQVLYQSLNANDATTWPSIGPWMLASGDAIEGQAGAASSNAYVIGGLI